MLKQAKIKKMLIITLIILLIPFIVPIITTLIEIIFNLGKYLGTVSRNISNCLVIKSLFI